MTRYFEDIDREREVLKELLVDIQNKRLIEGMMKLSKTDSLLLNYTYDGQIKPYLRELPFYEARVIFLLRARMFPTKTNFPKRWSVSSLCTFCCKVETDERLFHCCGYVDIHKGGTDYQTFIKLDCDMEKLSHEAKILLQIHERLLRINEDSTLNGGGGKDV